MSGEYQITAETRGAIVRSIAGSVTPNAVFLNIPYDQRFRSLYLAYIAGLVHLGFVPRVTLGLPGGTRRLDKILAEIQGCRYSIHDLSRVGLDRSPPFTTPRFNMPFELGLAVAWEKSNPAKHTWFLFEAKAYRVQKSLSDLNGTDPHIHGGHVAGVMRGLSNVFRRPRSRPTVPEMMRTFNTISRRSAKILAEAGAESLFEARVFQDLCYEAKVASENLESLK
jgi:hypothetical protein